MRNIVALLLTLTLVSRASHIHNPSGGQCIGGLIHPPTSGAISYSPPAPDPAPTVSSVSPTAGALAGGTSLSVTGTNFLSGATAAVGGTACTSPNVINSTSLSCTLPAKSAGTYAVAVTNSDGQSGSLSNAYTYQAAPTVSSVSPSTGTTAGGDAVTITGTGFLSGATAALGGTTCTSPNVTNSTTLTCTTGARSAGLVNAVVTNTDTQSGTGTNAFTYEAPFSPLSLSNLTTWLDASDSTQLFTNTGCSSAVSSDGDVVKCWKDKSGSSRNVTEATNGPAYKTAIKNGKSVLLFDGSNDKLVGSTAMVNLLAQASKSVWVVADVLSIPAGGANPPNYASAGLIGEDAGGSWGLHVGQSTKYGVWNNDGAGDSMGGTIAASTWYIFHIRHDSGTMYVSVNNGTEVSMATGNTDWYLSNYMRIGGNYGPVFTNMYMAEVVLSNGVESAGNRTSMQTYLNNKWAVY